VALAEPVASAGDSEDEDRTGSATTQPVARGIAPCGLMPTRDSVHQVIDDELVAEAVHDTGVRRLQHAYADVVNRRAWPEMDRLFLPDATVTLDLRAGEMLLLTGGPEVGEFIKNAIEQFEFFEFVILNAHVDFPDGALAGHAVSRLFMSEVRQDRLGGRWTTVYGVYHDRYVLRSDRWWIAERKYHSLARRARDLDTFPFPSDPGLVVPGISP